MLGRGDRTGVTVDDPDLATEKVRRDVFLRAMYLSILQAMIDRLELPTTPALVVEVGAAGGITKDIFPWVETSDVRAATGVDRVIDGAKLPYEADSLDGLIAKDALHHIPDPHAHFAEVARVLKPGARAVYVEPNWNRLSRFIFSTFHPEPFQPGVSSWTREHSAPMDSNQALAYIVFERDLKLFRESYPALRLMESTPCNGLAFLLSGGVHSRTPVPASWLTRLKRREDKHPALLRKTGLNRLIVLERRGLPDSRAEGSS